MKYTKEQFDKLYEFAFSPNNTGFKPSVIESPDGNGVWDTEKQYAHIAPKYLDLISDNLKKDILPFYDQAIEEANYICEKLGIDKAYWAGPDSTLRILRYPPGATTAPHLDFDLFTLSMYRVNVDAFKYLSGENDQLLQKAKQITPGIHFGELISEITGSQATRHEVVGIDEWSYSAVFFVVPNHEAILPSGLTVGQWMEERKNRSRKSI